MDKYIAFISYRHRQPDQAVATRLHRMLEHYRLPKNLRPEGKNRLGRVFRDEDELPLSTDLGESIRTALENSEFLIAICTPEYQKSRWCMEELNSFIAMHGADHVLAVLAEGTPEESFPPQILFTLDEQGRQKAIEPLAANIVAPSLKQSLNKLKTEKLRLIASMLNCSYDTLYQREKRYQQRRILAFSGITLTVAAVFIGMLLSKNAQIREQYEETRKNLLQVQLDESVSLTENAQSDLLLGRRSDAIRSLLKAVPEDGRPFDPAAEGELADALRVYANKKITFSSNIRQDSEIKAWTLSGDGSLVFTWDSFGLVRAFSASNGNLLWQNSALSSPSIRSDYPIIWMEKAKGILCVSETRIFLLSADSGQEYWSYETDHQPIYAAMPGVSGDDIVLIKRDSIHAVSTVRLDLTSGSVLDEKTISSYGADPHTFGPAASASGACAALVEAILDENNHRVWNLLILDRNSLEIHKIPVSNANPADFTLELDVTPSGLLTLAMLERNESEVYITLKVVDMDSKEILSTMTADGTVASTLNIEARLACSDEYALVSCYGNLYIFPLDSTQQVRATAMHGKIADIVKASLRVSQHTFIVTFDNGLTSFLMCDEEGIILTHDVWLYSFSSSIPFQSARIFPDLEIVTAIPEGRPNELLIILEEGPDPIEPVFSSYYSNQAVSPSGQKAFMGTSDAFMILSIPENRVLNELPFYRDKFYFFDYDDTAVFTSDEEHVIIDKWIISLTDGAAEALSVPSDESIRMPVSAWIPALGKAQTAVMTEKYVDGSYAERFFRLYMDGEDRGLVSLPEEYRFRIGYTDNSIWTMGGNGLLLIGAIRENDLLAPRQLFLYDTVNGQWCPLSEKITITLNTAAAAANTSRWFALHDGNRLALYDPTAEQPLWEIETDYASEAVSGIWPSPDDSLLLVTYGAQRIAVYRTSDGQLLSNLPFSFLKGHYLRLQQAQNGRLYVFTSTNYGYDDALILNSETGELISRIPSAVFVNLQTDHIYINNQTDGTLACYPLYSLNDLREEARKYLK